MKEGHNALLYINRCHDTGHVPSVASLQSLEHTLVRVHKASNALQVGEELRMVGWKQKHKAQAFYTTRLKRDDTLTMS